MGQNAKRKRQRATLGPVQKEEGAAAASPGHRHRVRLILLTVIPVVAVSAAIALIQLLDSRPSAGIVLLLGCAVWITTFASDVGDTIPRRDRTRSSGLGFGRKS
jgi:hypothetical protein